MTTGATWGNAKVPRTEGGCRDACTQIARGMTKLRSYQSKITYSSCVYLAASNALLNEKIFLYIYREEEREKGIVCSFAPMETHDLGHWKGLDIGQRRCRAVFQFHREWRKADGLAVVPPLCNSWGWGLLLGTARWNWLIMIWWVLLMDDVDRCGIR